MFLLMIIVAAFPALVVVPAMFFGMLYFAGVGIMYIGVFLLGALAVIWEFLKKLAIGTWNWIKKTANAIGNWFSNLFRPAATI